MIIAFSFLTLLNDNYKKAIETFNSFDGNNWIHFDVMDGNFVENKTFNNKLVKSVNAYNNLFSDVHLMVNNPFRLVKKYAKAGANLLTFHYESIKEKNIYKLIKKIKDNGMKVGISIKPNTDVKVLKPYLGDIDCILIMSVEPGKGGQSFIPSSIDKIKYLNDLKHKYHYLIAVDGGINNETSKLVKEVGCDVIIVGSYLANNLDKKIVDNLK